MEDKELKEIVAKAIEPKLKEQFLNGMLAGWTACAESLYKQATSMSKAKDIKSMLKAEVDKRHLMTTVDELHNKENSD